MFVAAADAEAAWFTSGTYGRHGWLRRLGHGGNGVGAVNPGITGSTSEDGRIGEYAMPTVPLGTDSLNDQTGCAPFGPAIVTRIRDPARYTCPW